VTFAVSSRRPVFPLPNVRGHEAVLRDSRGRGGKVESVSDWDAMAVYGKGEGCRRSVLGVGSVVECLGAGDASGDSGDGDSRVNMVAMRQMW